MEGIIMCNFFDCRYLHCEIKDFNLVGLKMVRNVFIKCPQKYFCCRIFNGCSFNLCTSLRQQYGMIQ